MENLFFYCTSWTWCYQIFFLKRLLLTDQDFIHLVKNCSIEKNQYNVFICNSKSNTKTFLFHFYILSNKYVAHFLSNTKFFHELLRKMCINDNGIDIFDKKKRYQDRASLCKPRSRSDRRCKAHHHEVEEHIHVTLSWIHDYMSDYTCSKRPMLQSIHQLFKGYILTFANTSMFP